MYKIDKNIPLPKTAAKYPFADMDVGHSFYAKDKNASTLYYAASKFKKANHVDWKFTVKPEGTGARIWRVF